MLNQGDQSSGERWGFETFIFQFIGDWRLVVVIPRAANCHEILTMGTLLEYTARSEYEPEAAGGHGETEVKSFLADMTAGTFDLTSVMEKTRAMAQAGACRPT